MAIETAQALFQVFDTSLARKWRDEDRKWREEERAWHLEDVGYRQEERDWKNKEWHFREEVRRWRAEDMLQREIDNARYVWNRFVELNRRDVEEKSEQLKSISNLAALFSGFALMSLVDFQFPVNETNEVLLCIYGVLSATTVGIFCTSTVICSLMLASILRTGKSYVNEEAEEEFIFRTREYLANRRPGDRPPGPKRTFEAHWQLRCEDTWVFACFLFTLGVPCFIANVCMIGWIKFTVSPVTKSLITAVVAVTILLWAYTHYLWGTYLTDRTKLPPSGDNDTELPNARLRAGMPYDWHLRPRKYSS